MPTFRWACRQLLHTPRLTIAAVLCIGLGASATSAVTTLVAATLVRPLPFPDSDRLTRIWFSEAGINPRVSLSMPDVDELHALGSFERILGTARVRVVAQLGDRAERLRGEAVSPGYFETLAVGAAHGRVLGSADHDAAAPSVAVISHRAWMTHFGADPNIQGRTLTTAATTYSIIGVAAPGFSGTVEDDVVEFWIPWSRYEPAAYARDRMARYVWVIGKLRPGVGLEAAQAEVAAHGVRLAAGNPVLYRNLSLRVEPMGENWRSGLRRGGTLLMAAAGLLLIIACVNVAGLLVTRVVDRRRELAVRASLGATRRHLVGQLTLEALLLVAAGSIAGIAAARVVLRGFLAVSPVTLPSYVTLEPDATALAMAIAALAVAGLAAGIVPALLGSRVTPGETMRAAGRGLVGGRGERRWGSVLVIAETAATVVLVVTGALLLRSWQQLETTDLGFRVDRIARLAITINRLDAATPADVPAIIERARAAVAAQPVAERVGLVWPTLPPWDPGRTRVRSALLEPEALEQGLDAGAHVADAGFFDVLGVPILEGRGFQITEGRTAIVSRGLAARLGGAPAVLDREITLQSDDMTLPAGTFRVVGVAGDVAYDGLAEQETRRYISYRSAADPRAGRYDVYLPLAAFPSRQVSIGVLTRGDEAAAIEPLRRALASVAPASAVHWTGTMTDELGIEYAASRFYAVLVASFSASALLLTAVGVFAVLSHGVARRTPEIGIRIALGATPRAIGRLVATTGLWPLAAGLTIGFALALLSARALAGVLYETASIDPVAFAGAGAVLFVTGLVAVTLPMRRAGRVDPLAALRQ